MERSNILSKRTEHLRCQHVVDTEIGSDFTAYVMIEGAGHFYGAGICDACLSALREMLDGEPFRVRVKSASEPSL
jgi:hypothetical protein